MNKVPPLGPGISTPDFVIMNIASNVPPITSVVPMNDFTVDFHVGVKYAGAMVPSRATHNVRL